MFESINEIEKLLFIGNEFINYVSCDNEIKFAMTYYIMVRKMICGKTLFIPKDNSQQILQNN